MSQTICGLSWKPRGDWTLCFNECCPEGPSIRTTLFARPPRSGCPALEAMAGHWRWGPAEARLLPQSCLHRSRLSGLPRPSTPQRQHRQRHRRYQARPPKLLIQRLAPRPLKLSSRNALPVRATRGGAGSNSLHRRHRPCVIKRGFALLLIGLCLPAWKRRVFRMHRKLRAKR